MANDRATASPAPLARLLGLRLAGIALCVLFLQAAYVAWDYSQQGSYLATTANSEQMDELAASTRMGLAEGTAPGSLQLPADLEARYLKFPEHYGAELRRVGGAIVVVRNPQVLRGIPIETGDLTEDIHRVDSVDGHERHYGSQAFLAGTTAYRWRVAMIDDPANVKRAVLLQEVANHVSMPAIPLILVMLATIWLVLRKTLRPLETAAATARLVVPAKDSLRLDLAGAPSEVVALGDAVNRLLDRLRDALSAQRDFAANVAHELRTPLSLLTLELASIEEPAALRAKADAQAMTNLINQLLAMAQLEALDTDKLVPVDLSAMCREVASQLAPIAFAAGKEIEFVGAAAVRVRGQPESLVGALRNLVDNALRVTPPGGTVRIEAVAGPVVNVFDQGPGIAIGQEQAIFNRFNQGDRKSRGTAGLGLAIVKRTMELHRGTARAKNLPGGGACFSLDFSPGR